MTTRTRIPHHQVISFAALCIAACSTPDIIDVEVLETSGDDGLFAPDVDLPEADTDEDPDPVFLPPGECIQFPIPGIFGYRHQCDGLIKVSFDAQGETGQDSFTFGPGKTNPDYWTEEDSYPQPLVAACCGQFDEDVEDDKLPYLNSCLFDAVQQICHGLPWFLRRQAEALPNDEVIKKVAINSLANTVENNQADCVQSLWGGGPPGPEGLYPNEIEGTQWSPANGVDIKIDEIQVYDWTSDGEEQWSTCTGMFDNDDAVVPTAPFEVPGVIASTNFDLLEGSAVMGSGPFEASGLLSPSQGSMTLASLQDGTSALTAFSISSGQNAVTVAGEAINIERAQLRLERALHPVRVTDEYYVSDGDAHFIASLIVAGERRMLTMINQGPLVFSQRLEGSLEFEPFELIYDEFGVGTWTLEFDGLSFGLAR